MLGLTSIRLHVELSKLRFFAALCRIDARCTAKKLFLVRLFHVYFGIRSNGNSFTLDVWNIFHKYDLQDVLYDFLQTGFFPAKVSWKHLTKGVLMFKYSSDWSQRLSICSDFSRFKHLQCEISPSPLWYLSKCFPNLCRTFKNVAKLWTLPPDCELACAECNVFVEDAVAHCLLDCSSPLLLNLRDRFFSKIVNDYPVHVYVFLDQSCREAQIATILGSPPAVIKDIFADDDHLLVSFVRDCCIFAEKASSLTFN